MPYKYIVTDSQNIPLSLAYLTSKPDAEVLELKVPEEEVDIVVDHEKIRLVCLEGNSPTKVARILSYQGNTISLEPLETLGSEVRENLRVLASYESFLYPLSDDWTGRLPVQIHDLSSSGAAFFCEAMLESGEVVELAIPATEPPLLMKTKILRRRPTTRNSNLYAAKFVDIIDDEEFLLRESVFSHQIRNRKSAARK